MKKSDLKKYAKLVVRVGANVRPGQTVVINSSVEHYEFVTLIVEEAYKAKAKEVLVEWGYDPIKKLSLINCSLETLSTFETWREEKLKQMVKDLPAQIHVISPDPDALKGVDLEKMAKYQQAIYPIIMPYRKEMDNKYQWTIVGVPSISWATKVFPNESPKKAVEKLWDYILDTARVKGNPIKNWKEHNDNLARNCQKMNDFQFDYLEYRSKNGTDLKIKLNPRQLWVAGGESTLQGVYYNPNIPTEECFGMPDKFGVNGKVVASKPLSYQGQLIENFEITFKDGKVESVKAEKGEDVLKQMVSMDEGASYLGEVALVPFDSPISKSGVLFYNTLFDENASCHLALGQAYTCNFVEHEKMTEEEIKALNYNESMIHVDFMVGTEDMDIVGVTKEGKKVQVFQNGNWAI